MTASSPNPANPYLAPTRAKLRWEYWFVAVIVVLLGGVAIAMIAMGATATKPAVALAQSSNAAPIDPSGLAATGDADPTATATGDDSSGLTMDDARMLVDDSAGLKLDARWDEALDRLTSITGAEQRTELGVAELTTKLQADHTRWSQLDTLLTQQVTAGAWHDANRTIAQLATIAHLDDAHLATRTTIRLQLAPKAPIVAAPATITPVQPAADAATSSPTKPAAATPTASDKGTTALKSDDPLANATAAKATAAAAAGNLIQQGIDSLPAADGA